MRPSIRSFIYAEGKAQLYTHTHKCVKQMRPAAIGYNDDEILPRSSNMTGRCRAPMRQIFMDQIINKNPRESVASVLFSGPLVFLPLEPKRP